MVTKTDALKRFGVTEKDLSELDFFAKTSGRNFKMKLYLESQLVALVAQRDGGGIDGEAKAQDYKSQPMVQAIADKVYDGSNRLHHGLGCVISNFVHVRWFS